MENKIRNTLNQIYFGKTRDIVNSLRESMMVGYLVFLLTVTASESTEHPCESPQYLELGKTGRIDCSFPENYLVVSWFDSSNYRDDTPLIVRREAGLGGRGYSSGEYDILLNGSLVIKNVSTDHEHTFTVVTIFVPTDNLSPHFVDVVTVGLPQERYPRITNCSEPSPGIYYSQFLEGGVFECSVDHVRPAFNLTWTVRGHSAEENVVHGRAVGSGPVFSTHAVLTDPFINSASLALAVCDASSPLDILDNNAAYLFLQVMDHRLSTDTLVKYIEKGSVAVLTCPKLAMEGLLAWNLKNTKSQTSEMVVFAAFGTVKFTSAPVSEAYALSDNGSLIIYDAAIGHNGIYSCANSDTEQVRMYDVQVHAPADPEVDGCDPSRYCVLDAKEHDNLTCTIRGVPKDVRLEFRAVEPSGIRFMDSTTIVQVHQAGTYYDVSFSTKYEITRAASELVVIECGVINPRTELFSGTTVLSVRGKSDIIPMDGAGENNQWLFLMAVLGIFCLFILSALVWWRCACHHSSQDSQKRRYSPAEQDPGAVDADEAI